MRLREIQQILKSVDFEKTRLEIDYHSNILSNIGNFKLFLDVVDQLSIYDNELSELYKSGIYKTSQNSLQLESKESRDIYSIACYLNDSASSLSLVFKKLLPASNEDSVNVKLPEPSDFEDLVKTMSTLQKSLSQVVVHKDIDGYVNINNWEHGSYWIELILGTQAAVAVVSSIAWAAAVVSKKYNENKILEKTVRSLDIKNESLEDILKSQKEMTRILVEAEANQVVDKHFTDRDPEQIKRVQASIKTFAKLIQDGAEVHSSLMAPEEVKNLFPDYKKIDLITSKIKQLEQLPADNDEGGD